MKKFLLLAAFACVTACGERAPSLKYGPAELDHSSLRPVKVNSRVFASGSFLGMPGRMLVSGDYLLVLDGATDSAVHVISTRDGHRVRSIGRRGKGPGEFEGARSFAVRSAGDPPWVFDISLGRLTQVDPATPFHPASARTLLLAGEVLPVQPLWLNDTLLVSPNFSDRGRLTFFNSEGKFLRGAGTLPSAPGTPPSVLQQAWVGGMTASRSRGLLAIATFYADQLEIFRNDGTLVRKVRGPFHFDPQYTVANAGGMLTMSSGDAMRIGYSSVVSTDEYIYAVFSGRTREGFGPSSSFGRYIHVFDWDGELVKVLELDTAVLSLALSADHRTLYASRHEPEPAILTFQIPN
ncbi:BF3164 family lipoprotein [Longimicrobium terrae]|uniref:6-bladed beta-propeller n=1 Tax=Longimicrobium terrae TaxID=1639882 RepID=A0A841GN57_9BACT|nr:BF3164 family lipoprotein [Longimicrobium terrae]MBB4635845.1 hypothetical protein [Longimicrobium terrae]MBB6070241.1 hypothetical protein [Longimicrobium terrae]NNC30745.1 hypothetical protein [Longimicrobium terrae]